MKKSIILLIILIIILFFFAFLYIRTDLFWQKGKPNFEKKQTKKELSRITTKEKLKAYENQFFEMFRDPSSNTIPSNIRLQEQEFLKKIINNSKSDLCLSTPYKINWIEAGPNDVGGRTRALALDVANSDIILAGGVTGGLWKSTDGGKSWKLKSDLKASHSVTALAQDIRKGHTDTWYYGTGEYTRNSVIDQVFRYWYLGNGIFKSTDNGESWQLLENTKCDPLSNKSYFNFVSNIVVCPVTGYVFVAANEHGILRSKNGGKDFEFVLGGTDTYYYTDVAKTMDGKIIAFLSQYGTHGGRQISCGIFVSFDHGDTWKNITPPSYPQNYHRAVLGTTAANNNILYVLTYTGQSKANGSDDLRLHKIYLDKDSSVDKSKNLPNNPELGFISSIDVQDCYNMVISVKPDDENYVIVGGTSLYRSFDGFSSFNKEGYKVLIGGYHPIYFEYPNQHPDEHVIAFDYKDPNKMWVGHDGGLSFSNNIMLPCDSTQPLPWENKNNGYNVTQFYTVSLFDSAGDTRLMGGTQDNGSPYFRFDDKNTTKSVDVSGGDGAYGYIGRKHLFSSIYFGMTFRVPYNKDGEPNLSAVWNAIWPKNASGQLFYNQFAIDPNNENIMYYPSGNTFWRNSDLSAIPEDYSDQNGTTINWTMLSQLTLPECYRYTALAVSNSNPKHLLYVAASSFWENPQFPKIYKLENSDTSNNLPIDISIPNAPKGAYVNCIAVNPNDGNEVIVVMSNYNIIGLYHTSDGGEKWDAIEGNLAGDGFNFGPAITSASILPTDFGNIYLVGTTVGVFSTMQLNGMSTQWRFEGSEVMGNILVYDIKSREADSKIAIASWGRGIFVGYPDFSTFVENNRVNDDIILEIYPNPAKDLLKLIFSNNSYDFIKIGIYNILGTNVKSIYQKLTEPSKHEIPCTVNDLPNGFYYVRLDTKTKSITKLLVISK